MPRTTFTELLFGERGTQVFLVLLVALTIAVLVALILFIHRRPRGLFPQTGRAAESQS